MINRNDILELAGSFNSPGEGLIHSQSKEGCTEVIIAGDGITIACAVSCIIRRVADKFKMPCEEFINDLMDIMELNNKHAKIWIDGDFQPYEENEGYRKAVRDELEDEYRRKKQDLEKDRQQYIEELKKKSIKINALMSRIDEQRESFAREKKALQLEIKRGERTIRRMEQALIGVDTVKEDG